VRLRDVPASRHPDFAHGRLVDFAEAMVLAGEWTAEEAWDLVVPRSEALFAPPRDHRFREAVEAGQVVGWAWTGPAPDDHPGRAWLYQITVDEARRGQGLGRAMLRALERTLAAEGWEECRLNVFRYNLPAISLYRSEGWSVVQGFEASFHMAKRLR
jgi:ribosomal protein S18 acetylase RimI-like enzyme